MLWPDAPRFQVRAWWHSSMAALRRDHGARLRDNMAGGRHPFRGSQQMPSMTKAQRDAFLRETRIATLVTLNEDGSPNALPLWYDWDGERLRMFSQSGTGKLRRLERDPRVCVSVADPVGALESWVTVEGRVEIRDAGGRELALRLAKRYYAPDRAERTIRAWSKLGGWKLLELTPTRIRSYLTDMP